MRNKRKSADHGIELSAYIASQFAFLKRHQEQAFPGAAFGPQASDLVFLDFTWHVAQTFTLVLDNENTPSFGRFPFPIHVSSNYVLFLRLMFLMSVEFPHSEKLYANHHERLRLSPG